MRRYLVLLIVMLMPMIASAKKLQIDFDVAQFRCADGKVNLELYYMFPDTSFYYVRDGEAWKGELKFNLKLIEQGISLINNNIDEAWNVSTSAPTKPETHSLNMFGQRGFEVMPGSYKAVLRVTDNNDSTTLGNAEFFITIDRISDTSLAVSDMELATAIFNEQEAGAYANPMFYKNGLYIYPNPANEVHGESLVLNAYYEIYNGKDFANQGVELTYRITDGAKREIYLRSRKIEPPSNAIADVINIPVDAAPTGVYYLNAEIKSLNTNEIITREKKFFLLNSKIAADLEINFTESQTFEQSEFATLSPERVEDEYNKAKVIATSFETDAYDLLSENKARQRFLYRFWKLRDPDTATVKNERLDEFRRCIEYANNTFANPGQGYGWKTDRGRIVMKYGMPDNVDKHPAKTDERAYEEWFYNKVDGGAYFYFVDYRNNGNLRLVHSTAATEVKCEDWKNQYIPAQRSPIDPKKTDSNTY